MLVKGTYCRPGCTGADQTSLPDTAIGSVVPGLHGCVMFRSVEDMLATRAFLDQNNYESGSVNLSRVSGLPAMVVPAGFTRVAYERVPDTRDANGSRLERAKRDRLPAAEFVARAFDEALLFEITSAYEAGAKRRLPPNGLRPLKDEP
jgi:hypothetical protein